MVNHGPLNHQLEQHMARDLDENSIVGSRGKIEPMDFGGSHGLKQPKKGFFSNH